MLLHDSNMQGTLHLVLQLNEKDLETSSGMWQMRLICHMCRTTEYLFGNSKQLVHMYSVVITSRSKVDLCTIAPITSSPPRQHSDASKLHWIACVVKLCPNHRTPRTTIQMPSCFICAKSKSTPSTAPRFVWEWGINPRRHINPRRC